MYSKSTQTQLTPAPPVPQQEGLLASIDGKITANASMLVDISQRLQRVADRILGCDPEGADSMTPAGPHCQAARVDHSITCLAQAMAQLDIQVARIEQL